MKTPDTYKAAPSKPNFIVRRLRDQIAEWSRQFELKWPALCLGEITELEKRVSVRHWIKWTHRTWGDYDRYVATFDTLRYPTIYIFQVIEHLMNPLLCLEDVTRHMTDDGIILLTTPLERPPWLRSEAHFHEFQLEDLLAMIEKAGLEVVDLTIAKPMPWWSMFLGVRPVLRYLFWGKWALLALNKSGQTCPT